MSISKEFFKKHGFKPDAYEIKYMKSLGKIENIECQITVFEGNGLTYLSQQEEPKNVMPIGRLNESEIEKLLEIL